MFFFPFLSASCLLPNRIQCILLFGWKNVCLGIPFAYPFHGSKRMKDAKTQLILLFEFVKNANNKQKLYQCAFNRNNNRHRVTIQMIISKSDPCNKLPRTWNCIMKEIKRLMRFCSKYRWEFQVHDQKESSIGAQFDELREKREREEKRWKKWKDWEKSGEFVCFVWVSNIWCMFLCWVWDSCILYEISCVSFAFIRIWLVI